MAGLLPSSALVLVYSIHGLSEQTMNNTLELTFADLDNVTVLYMYINSAIVYRLSNVISYYFEKLENHDNHNMLYIYWQSR